MFNLKKYTLYALAATVTAASLFGQSEILWGSNYAKGNTVFGAAAAYETGQFYNQKALALYPSAELLLWKPNFGGYAPLDLGLAAEGRLGLPLSKETPFVLGAGGGAAIHFGFKGFDFPYAEYLGRLDLFARIGVSFDLIKGVGDDALGLIATSGANYFIDDRLMLGLAYTGWGSGYSGYDGVSVQVQYRLGKTPVVKGMGDAWQAYQDTVDAVEAIGPVTQFYAFYIYAVYSGGYYWAPESYEPGQGGLWRYTEDGEDPFFLERVLLDRTAEGDEWWSLTYSDGEGEEYPFEFLLSADKELQVLYYRDDSGRVKMYDFLQEDPEHPYLAQMEEVSYGDLTAMAEGRETVTVPAGTFKDCYLVHDENDEGSFSWWFSPDKKVNGSLVRFVNTDNDITVTAELEELINGRQGQFKLRQ
jgi:hypothetical protein